MQTEPAPTHQQTAGNPTVWFALLGGPLAWFAHLLAMYGLVYLPCGPRLPLFLAASLAAAAVAVAAVVVSFRLARGHDGVTTDRGTPSGRNRFAGYGGLLSGSLFLLIILVAATPPLVLDRCA